MEPSRISTFFSNLSTGKKYILSILSLVLFSLLIILSVYETSKATVTVFIDGEEQVIQTHAKTVSNLMNEQGWVLSEHDEITPTLNTKVEGNMTIEWNVAKEVMISVNGEEKSLWTTASDIEALLGKLDISVGEFDKVSPSITDTIEDGMNIVYESAFEVTLNSDGEQLDLMTTSTTVADFLERHEIALGELDRTEPAVDEMITKATDINVIRVEKVTDVVEEKVAYATVTRRDNGLDNGRERVVQEGSEGLVKNHYQVILENGKEVSRELIKKENIKETTDKIVAVGTRQPTASVSRGGSSSSNQAVSGKTFTVESTAYTAGCAGCSGITATGINLNNNRNAKVIAVDPSVIPLGTKVYVEGYGEAIAGDVGRAIKGNKIDVHLPTKDDARRWGRKNVQITILQ